MKHKKPVLRWIKASDLKTHPVVQRALNEKQVEEIAAAFRPDSFGTITVVEGRNHRLLIIDGQHRWAAIQRAVGSAAPVPCSVITVDDEIQDGARIFLDMNRERRSVHSYDRFVQEVNAGEDAALAVMAALKEVRLKVGQDNKSGTIRAVEACKSVYARGGAAGLRRTLAILTTAWPDDPDSVYQSLIRGVALLTERANGALDDAALARRLGRSGTANSFIGRSREWARTRTCSAPRAVAEMMMATYNKGRSTGKVEI